MPEHGGELNVHSPTNRRTVRAGRPSKLTREVQDQFVGAIRAGCHFSTAAELTGVGESTARRWLGDPRPVYRAFAAEVKKAEAQHEAMVVASLTRSIDKHPGVGLKFLQLRHRQRWGDSGVGQSVIQTVDETARARTEQEANYVTLTLEEVRAIAQYEMLRRQGRAPRLDSLRLDADDESQLDDA